METILQDVRYAARMLWKRRGFTALAVGILALGIGANSAIFSVVDAALLRPLPFREPDRLLQLYETESAAGEFPLTGQDFLDWRAQNHTFDDICVYSYQQIYNASSGGQAERVTAVETQSNFHALLGVAPLIGRTFAAGEDQAGKNRVAVLSYPFWQTHFGGQRDVLGKTLELNGAAYNIVGVMPAWYQVPGSADLWIPIDMSAKNLGPRGEHHLRAIGRMKKGVTIAQAEADLKAIAAQLEKQFPDSNEKVGAVVEPLKEALVGDSRQELSILFGAVALVLLIACANVANLLLARASERRREVAMRGALGASRGRLVRQLLTESVLLALLGGALGVALAYAGVPLLANWRQLPVPRANPIEVNVGVLLFTLSVSAGVGILFGLAPALETSRANINKELKAGGSMAATAGGRGRMLRDALVMAEVALSLALLTGAGLLIRTFANLRAVDVGARADRVLIATIELPPERYADIDSQWQFYERLTHALERAPGAKRVALSTELPLEASSNGYVISDAKNQEDTKNTLVEWNSITPDYFRALGIPLIEGRGIEAGDVASTLDARRRMEELDKKEELKTTKERFEIPTVINREMARRFWPRESAIGHVFGQQMEVVHYRVIGVVGDVKVHSLRAKPMPQAYFPFPQALSAQGRLGPNVIVESGGAPADVAGAIQSAVHKLDAGVAVADLRTMPQIVAASMAGTSYQTMLLGSFAGLALLLAGVGIYGVMSYVVSQRTSEFGIRMALGAEAWDVLRLVTGQGARLALLGTAAGIAASLALARVMGTLLFGVKPGDLATYAAVSVITVATCLLAGWLPARRAARVDPIVALRYE